MLSAGPARGRQGDRRAACSGCAACASSNLLFGADRGLLAGSIGALLLPRRPEAPTLARRRARPGRLRRQHPGDRLQRRARPGGVGRAAGGRPADPARGPVAAVPGRAGAARRGRQPGAVHGLHGDRLRGAAGGRRGLPAPARRAAWLAAGAVFCLPFAAAPSRRAGGTCATGASTARSPAPASSSTCRAAGPTPATSSCCRRRGSGARCTPTSGVPSTRVRVAGRLAARDPRDRRRRSAPSACWSRSGGGGGRAARGPTCCDAIAWTLLAAFALASVWQIVQFYTTGGNAHVRYLYAALPVAGALATVAFRVLPVQPAQHGHDRRHRRRDGARLLPAAALLQRVQPGRRHRAGRDRRRIAARRATVRPDRPRAAPDRTREPPDAVGRRARGRGSHAGAGAGERPGDAALHRQRRGRARRLRAGGRRRAPAERHRPDAPDGVIPGLPPGRLLYTANHPPLYYALVGPA